MIDKLAADIGVGKASLEAMIARGATDPDFHQEQFRVLRSSPKESILSLLEVAMADGKLTENEIAVLKALSDKLGINDDTFAVLIDDVIKMLK